MSTALSKSTAASKSNATSRPAAESHRDLVRTSMKAELLDAETEKALARAWRDHGDEAALHRLTTAYMRLAVSMASKYRRYGAAMPDLIQEAGIGLMKAAAKFDPDREVRFSTYAVWWIRASIQDYVMRNWSIVRTGSTSAQKALFFNMRRVRARIEREMEAETGETVPVDVRRQIAEEIGVSVRDVELMEARLSGPDFSLNATQSHEEGREWIETIEDDGETPDESVTRSTDGARMRQWIDKALASLNERERRIVAERKLADEPRTLESLGTEFGLSKERIRQLEAQALRKMRQSLEQQLGPNAARIAAP